MDSNSSSRGRKVDQHTKQFLKQAADNLSKNTVPPTEIPPFVSSIFTEIASNEVFLVTNVFASPYLETIIKYTTHLQLRTFTNSILHKFDTIVVDKAGSYFMQTLLSTLFALSSSDVEDQSVPSISALLTEIFTYILVNCRFYFRNRFASHVIKSICSILSSKITIPGNINSIVRVSIGGRKPSHFHAAFMEDKADQDLVGPKVKRELLLLIKCTGIAVIESFNTEALTKEEVLRLRETVINFNQQAIVVNETALSLVAKHCFGSFVLQEVLQFFSKTYIISNILTILVRDEYIDDILNNAEPFGRMFLESCLEKCQDQCVLNVYLTLVVNYFEDFFNEGAYSLFIVSLINSISSRLSGIEIEHVDLYNTCQLLIKKTIKLIENSSQLSNSQLKVIPSVIELAVTLDCSRKLSKTLKSHFKSNGQDILSTIFKYFDYELPHDIPETLFNFLLSLASIPLEHGKWFYGALLGTDFKFFNILACTKNSPELIKKLFKSTNYSYHTKFLTKFLPAIFHLSIDTKGSFTVQALYELASVNEKKRICSQLLEYDQRLVADRIGSIIYDKLALAKFKQGEHAWMASISKKATIDDQIRDIFEQRSIKSRKRKRGDEKPKKRVN
ncbi:hypothetical protein P9112_012148 [Eukaryota sp. TZLM1-RC]